MMFASEHACQWRIAKNVGLDEQTNEIFMEPSPDDAKQLNNPKVFT